MSAAHAPRFRVCVLAGDGIGPEVMAEAVKVLKAATQAPGVEHAELEFVEAPVGGAAYEACGEHLPASTLHACALSDAVLFGSVGGPPDEAHLPKWKNAERNAILGIRKHFELAINLRPSRVVKSLAAISPLKDTVIGEGVDILIVRELVGGAYFGAHETAPDGRSARDDLTYTWEQVENALRFAFIACVPRPRVGLRMHVRECASAFVSPARVCSASGRRRKLTVVDKANVLETSRLWRAVTAAVKGDYPDVSVEFMYVDNAAMQLVTHPTSFDVIVTENLFGVRAAHAGARVGSLAYMATCGWCRTSSRTKPVCCPAPWD